jgi:hypothetical protein
MTTSKLTEDDIAWLESRLNSAIDPVMPRPEFIDRAREELMRLPVQPPARMKRAALGAVVLSLAALLVGMFYFYRRSQAE